MTFPMLPSAGVTAKGDALDAQTLREMAAAFDAARREMAQV